ncbi:MAG: inorganic diphosphatase [Gammaproteobacteria bacterium]
MSYNQISPGSDAPDTVNVIIEIPAQASPVKYEVDKDNDALIVDRFMGTAMFYPCNYGYIPQTLSEDDDPVDVLVMAPVPLLAGSVIKVRPIGVLNMTDEKGPDAKLLAVPVHKLTPMYDDIQSVDDVSSHFLDIIAHFFEHYKDLEKGKWVKIDGWAGLDVAKNEIIASLKRYKAQN